MDKNTPDKTPPPPLTPVAAPGPKPDSSLAIVSMVLGVMSLTGPGLLLGIPAIITAAIALKRNEESRGLSITGLVTGIISTLLSLIVGGFIIWAIIWSINNPSAPSIEAPRSDHAEQMFNSGQI